MPDIYNNLILWFKQKSHYRFLSVENIEEERTI